MFCYVDADGCIRSDDGERKFWMGEFGGVGSACFIYYTHRDYTGDKQDFDYKVIAAFTHRGLANPVYDLVARQITMVRAADQRTVAATFRQIGRQLLRLDNLCK